MNAGRTVMMIFPGDTQPTPVPNDSKTVAQARAAGAKLHLSTGQLAVKYFADAAPSLGSFTGGLLGAGGGAAATPEALGFGAIPGLAAGSALGRTAGSALQMGAYGAAGIPFDASPRAVAGNLGMNAAVGGGEGVLQGITGGLLPKAAPGMMKSAVGNALPGAEETALKAKDVMSNNRLAQLTGEIKGHSAAVQAAIDAETAAGKRTMNPNILIRSLRALRNRVRAADIPGRTTENAVDDALKTTMDKIGPQTTPASTIMAPGRGTAAAVSGPARPAVTTPAVPLTARQVENANKFAQDEISKLLDARARNGALDPTPKELAYQQIERVTRSWLRGIPDVAKNNAAASSKIARRDVIFEALKRKPPTGATAATVAGSLGYGVSHGDPRMLLLGLPAGAIQHMAGSPEAMSRAAILANDPNFARILNLVPRGAVLGANEFLNLGNPGLPRP